jgi:hypothetical protein
MGCSLELGKSYFVLLEFGSFYRAESLIAVSRADNRTTKLLNVLEISPCFPVLVHSVLNYNSNCR